MVDPDDGDPDDVHRSRHRREQLGRPAADQSVEARRARRVRVLDQARERRDGVPTAVIVEAVREGRGRP